MPQVSAIVPVYQAQKYISCCIESILKQTFSDFELILVDDGATDLSGKICDQYAQKDSRIRVIHMKNKGAAAARNRGLDAAVGNYIIFVDSDDYVEQDMFLKLYETIRSGAYDLVVCGFMNAYENSEKNFGVSLFEKTITGKDVFIHFKNSKNYGMWTVVWNKIYPAKLLKQIRFPEGKFFEDEFFSDQLYLRCKKIHVIPDILYNYRILSSSTMNTQKAENYLDLIDAFKQRIRIYLKNEFPCDEIYKLLIYLLEPYTICKQAHLTGISKKRLQADYKFIQKVAKRLQHTGLSKMKKCSLPFIALMPKTMYQTAMKFRERLEKHL